MACRMHAAVVSSDAGLSFTVRQATVNQASSMTLRLLLLVDSLLHAAAQFTKRWVAEMKVPAGNNKHNTVHCAHTPDSAVTGLWTMLCSATCSAARPSYALCQRAGSTDVFCIHAQLTWMSVDVIYLCSVLKNRMRLQVLLMKARVRARTLDCICMRI